MNRRSFLTGLAGILAATQAPALVSAGNIMRIKPVLLLDDFQLETIELPRGTFRVDGNADWQEIMARIRDGLPLDARTYRPDRTIVIDGRGSILNGSNATIVFKPTFKGQNVIESRNGARGMVGRLHCFATQMV